MTAEWDPTETARTDVVKKYPIIVHEPEICPPERLSPIYLKPGALYSLSITQVLCALPLIACKKMWSCWIEVQSMIG